MADADDKPGEPDLEPVPKLPRGRGLKLDGPMMFRIGATLILLIAIVVMRKPCADATSKFVTGFGDEGSGSGAVVKPGTVDLPAAKGSGSSAGSDSMEYVGGSASEAEVRAAWERAKAKARAEQGSAAGGSGFATSPASGSGSGSRDGSGSGASAGTGSSSAGSSAGSSAAGSATR